MTAEEAAAVLRKEVKFKKEDTIRKKNSKLIRAANVLRNAELEVLSGNPSPAPVGSPPGVRSGNLMRNWVPCHTEGGETGLFGILSAASYAGYLEHGTHNEDGSQRMGARPFVDRIQEKALPEITEIFEAE